MPLLALLLAQARVSRICKSLGFTGGLAGFFGLNRGWRVGTLGTPTARAAQVVQVVSPTAPLALNVGRNR